MHFLLLLVEVLTNSSVDFIMFHSLVQALKKSPTMVNVSHQY
jgi:hypothetical protein